MEIFRFEMKFNDDATICVYSKCINRYRPGIKASVEVVTVSADCQSMFLTASGITCNNEVATISVYRQRKSPK